MKCWKLLLSVACLAVLSGCKTMSTTPAEVEAGPIGRPSADLPGGGEMRKNAKIHVELGTAYFTAGRYGVALDEGRVAIAYDKDYAPGHELLGLVYMYLEQFQEARKQLEEASRLAPGDPNINNSFGWFLCSQGQEQLGIARIELAAKNPYYQTPSRAYTNLGLCWLRLKNDTEAEQHFTRAAQLNPSDQVAIYNLAAIAYRKTAYARARDLMLNLHKVMRPTAETLWLALRIEHQLGDRVEEAKYGAQLKKEFPDSTEYQAFLQGRFE